MLLRKQYLLTLLLLLFFGITLYSQTKRLNLEEQNPFLQAEKMVWFGTGDILGSFNPTDDAYRNIVIPGAKTACKVRQIQQYKEWLFFVLDTGLAALQLKLNDWLYFDESKGLPDNHVTGIDFQEDYVWISTPRGAARFDLLTEQWETIGKNRGLSDTNLVDIKIAGNLAWMIGINIVSEYDPVYEKWREYQIVETGKLGMKKAFVYNDELWLVTGNGLTRFNTNLKTKQEYNNEFLDKDNLLEIFYDESNIWALTKIGIFIYDKSSTGWKEFEGNSNLKAVNPVDFYIQSSYIWVVTDKNVMLWNRTQKSWEILDYSSGLSISNYTSVFTDGELTMLIADEFLDYRKSSTLPWRKYSLQKTNNNKGTGNFFTDLFDNPQGGSINLFGMGWSWQGTRIRFLQDFNFTNTNDGWETDISNPAYKMDIKNQLNLDEFRRINGFYNNIDYTETIYGLRYRGRDSDSISYDLMRELNLGDYRRDPGIIPFGENASLFGTNAWLQYGKKTSKFKRSLLSLKAGEAQIRSRKTYEIFSGMGIDHHIEIKSNDFVKNRFFELQGLDTTKEISNLEIFIDDLQKNTNTGNTDENSVIAGISGDYDPLIPSKDFYLSKWARAVVITKNISANSVITTRYSLNGQLIETVLKANSISTALKNIYYISPGIIPFSFKLKITDSTQKEIPLETFGIGKNNEVISEYADYYSGYIKFPAKIPFPFENYSDSGSVGTHTLIADFKTSVSIIKLNNSNLVRGTEKIRLDGIEAIPGNDYLLDYTNGTIIFIREGVLNPDTRIEIEYEYYIETDKRLITARLNYSPSDNFYLQADYLNPDSTSLLTVHSEIRQSVGEFDVRIIPALSYSSKTNGISSGSAEAFISSTWIRAQGSYQDYEKDYRNLYLPQSIIGQIDEKLQAGIVSDISDFIRLTGDYQKIKGFIDSANTNPTDELISSGFLIHKPDYPGIKMNFNVINTEKENYNIEKDYLQANIDYQAGKKIIELLSLNNLRLESFLRYGNQQETINKITKNCRIFQNYYRLNLQLTEQIQGGFFYRISKQEEKKFDGNYNNMITNERLLIDLSQEQWRLLQVNFKLENSLQQFGHLIGNTNSFYLNQFSQANLRLSPGEIWDPLSILFFEFNIGKSSNSTGILNGSMSDALWQINPLEKENTQSMQTMTTYYLKNELRASTDLLIYSIVEWNNTESVMGESFIRRKFYRFNEKFDIKLGFKTRLIAQYRQTYNDQGFNYITREYEPSIWLEHRWSQELQNILIMNYRLKEFIENKINYEGYSFESSCDLIYRTNNMAFFRYIEFRESLGFSSNNTNSNIPTDTYSFNFTSTVDAYPVNSVIVRTRVEIHKFNDMYNSSNNNLVIALNLKVTVQF